MSRPLAFHCTSRHSLSFPTIQLSGNIDLRRFACTPRQLITISFLSTNTLIPCSISQLVGKSPWFDQNVVKLQTVRSGYNLESGSGPLGSSTPQPHCEKTSETEFELQEVAANVQNDVQLRLPTVKILSNDLTRLEWCNTSHISSSDSLQWTIMSGMALNKAHQPGTLLDARHYDRIVAN